MIVRRPRFVAGTVLGVDDLEALAAYLEGRQRAANRELHGTGVVRGLDITCDRHARTVTVGPGAAVDAAGRLIQLEAPVTVPAGGPGGGPRAGGFVVLRVAERLADPVPTPHGVEYRTVEEVPVVEVVVAPSPGQLVLGPCGRAARRPAPIARRVRLTAAEPTGLRARASRRFL